MEKKMKEIHINRKRCKACSICIDLCPQKVYGKEADGKPVVVNIDKCTVCRLCEFRCPDFAIKIGGGDNEN